MYGTISMLGRMEKELVSILGLPGDAQAGIVTESLWRSEPFRRMVRSAVGDSLVFEDMLVRHPVELLYAWFAFLLAPMLVTLVSGGRVADERRTGSARYMLMLVTRHEWSVGKYVGQAMLIACALAVSALGVWAVVLWRLPSDSAMRLLLPMFGWSAKTWVYSLSWLGLALGLSHMMRASGKAVALGLVCIGLFKALPNVVGHFVGQGDWPAALLHLESLVPSCAEPALWRNSAVAVASGACHLVTLGLVYLMAGAAFFARRDA